MAQESKSDREKRQATAFLRDLVVFDQLEPVKPDPPDIRVSHNGSPILNLELTEYHIDDDQVATNARWAKDLWPRVDALRRREAALSGILGFVVFSDNKLPSLRRQDSDQFAGELVRLAGQVSQELLATDKLKISFSPRTDPARPPFIKPGWCLLPNEDWPLISQHLVVVTFKRVLDQRVLDQWPRWTCLQTDAGWTQMTSGRFRRIFDDKDSKVRKACQHVQRFPPGVPLWLVIVCDMLNDMTSHLFPTNKEDREELFRAMRESGYDFSSSAFTEIWLYSDFSGHKLRLFPAPPSRT